jgi:hypothetical protein
MHSVSREELQSLDMNKQVNVDLVGINGNQLLGIKDLKSGSVNQTVGAGSLARLGHLLDVQKVAGSSPVRPTNYLNSQYFECHLDD